MSACFQYICCEHALKLSADAEKTCNTAHEVARTIVPADPVLCLETSLDKAEFLRYVRGDKDLSRRILGSAIYEAHKFTAEPDGVSSPYKGLSEIILEAQDIVKEWRKGDSRDYVETLRWINRGFDPFRRSLHVK